MRRYLTMSLGEVGHGSQKALKAMESELELGVCPPRARILGG